MLQQRLRLYALEAMRLVSELPTTAVGRTIGNQFIRCATSMGANYRAACRARSHLEFIAKIGIVIEESDEAVYWLELVVDGVLLSTQRVASLLQETREILAIMIASRKTAERSRVQIGNRQSAIGNYVS